MWSFFDYCSSTAAFSKIVSVLRCLIGDKSWLSWEPKLDRNQFSAAVEQFFYILETFPNLVTISAKHQILHYIWSSRKLFAGKFSRMVVLGEKCVQINNTFIKKLLVTWLLLDLKKIFILNFLRCRNNPGGGFSNFPFMLIQFDLYF